MSKKALRIRDILSIFILSLALAAFIYIIVDMFSNPLTTARSISTVLIFLLSAIIINITLGIYRYLNGFIKQSWLFYILQWTLMIILSMFITANVDTLMKDKIISSAKQEISSVIEYIDSYNKSTGSFPDNIDTAVGKISKINYIDYYKDDKTYLLQTRLSSIDIDGEVLFYNSIDKNWGNFHNDEYQYYKNKKNSPKEIKNYIEILKQLKLVKSYKK